MKEQTAVEWLLENLNSEPYSEKDFEHNKRCWEQAKEMEREQIVNAYNDCEWTGDHEDGEQYYKQTYENNN
jgi:hypothetical protein